MDCERLFGLSDDQFRRSTGVKRATFEKMTAIYDSDNPIEVILVDATETPIERPKKSRENTILARKSDIH